MYLRVNLSTTPGLKFWKPQHCTGLDQITDNFKDSLFCRILGKFTQRAKPICITGDPDNQRSDKWSSVKVKVKVAVEQTTKAQSGSRGIALGGLRHAPAALPPGKTRCPFYTSLCGSQGRSGPVRKISPPPGFDPRTVQPVGSRYTDPRSSTVPHVFALLMS
jgi:hypothetical protein